MRPLGLTDTIFYNLGDRYITAVNILSGPCNLHQFASEFAEITEEFRSLQDKIVRIWPWYFAKKHTEFAIEDHIEVINDPTVKDIDSLLPIIEKVRRTRLPDNLPPWRAYVVNPEPFFDQELPAIKSNSLCAVVWQLKHGMADATRCIQMLSGMRDRPPIDEVIETKQFRDYSRKELFRLPENVGIRDKGLVVVELEKQDLRQQTKTRERLFDAIKALLKNPALFDQDMNWKQQLAYTQVKRRRIGKELGNHLETVAKPFFNDDGRIAKNSKLKIPGLENIQKLSLSQYLVALSPRRLAKYLMSVWYSSFDAMLTILPLPSNLYIGGQHVKTTLGIPPISGPMPLLLLTIATHLNHTIVALPGEGFIGSKEQLKSELLAELTGVNASNHLEQKQSLHKT